MMVRQGKRQRSVSPTRRGWWLLALGIASLYFAYALQRSELLYLGSFLTALPLASFSIVRLRQVRTTVARDFTPPVAQPGQPLTVSINTHNLSFAASAGALWRDGLPWAPYESPKAQLQNSATTGGNETTVLRYELVPVMRGLVEIGPLKLDFTDPFGLAKGALSLGAASRLVVTPRLSHFADDALSVTSDEGSNRAVQRRSQGGEDDLMTRQYHRGDALRRVHWRASAHHGELMVRQEEQRSHAEARIVIDTLDRNYRDREPGVRAGEPESLSFEWVISFTASLGLFLERAGYIVHLVETGEEQLADPAHRDEFLESLAAARLVSNRAETSSLLRDVERPAQSQGSIFVVLAEPDTATLDALIAQRHAFGRAVIFIVGAASKSAAPNSAALDRSVTRLRQAGWQCVGVTTDTPLVDAWRAVGLAGEGLDGRR